MQEVEDKGEFHIAGVKEETREALRALNHGEVELTVLRYVRRMPGSRKEWEWFAYIDEDRASMFRVASFICET